MNESDSPFDVASEMISEDAPDTATATQAYEASYRRQTGEIDLRYFDGERLIDAAVKASELVDNDPFNTLIKVKELGPIN